MLIAVIWLFGLMPMAFFVWKAAMNAEANRAKQVGESRYNEHPPAPRTMAYIIFAIMSFFATLAVVVGVSK